ncbi:ABC transporter ATP-binding protein/permease [Photobacterium sanguinicancri]|uniref:ABC transporter ATP-binding protein/permease n=1 Tax=Photobacterium sanguinicancri TaxID=875932 RepID=UPI0026E36EE3|nr:SbmA/BacA-like family transporter [Photobacterium sanguinicancri]MDO6500439.1 SbmA/BacA-like family transporter [Photobacterium sanguinicancri]
MTRINLLIRLVSPYWRSKEGIKGWGLLLVTFLLTSLATYSSVYFAEWNATFYNALESRNYDRIIHEVYRFIYLLSAMAVIGANRTYFLVWLKLHWREWMTRTYTKQWLKDNRFYHVNRDSNIDNIDQRISADISIFTNETTTLFFSFLDAVMTVGSFVIVLWNLSGTLDFELHGYSFSIEGYLVYGAIIYAIFGFLGARVVGKHFKFLNWQGEKVEADYRRHVMTITEHTEAIAFAKAGSTEQKRLQHFFAAIYSNAKETMKVDRRFSLFTLFYGQGMFLPPLFLTLPKFLSGAIDLGGYMQIRIAFSQVVGSISWFSDSYDLLMSWFATMDRIGQVHKSITDDNNQNLKLSTNLNAMIIKELNLFTPKGQHLLSVPNWKMERGERCHISAPSGSGKTSLIKALMGLWPYASGSIEVSDNLLVISQRDYIPAIKLRDAITYPHSVEIEDDLLISALNMVNLSNLSEHLDTIEEWQQLLSGGERQRLKLAKCFILKPSWLILDEAFSAIDEHTAKAITNIMFSTLPNSGFLCIAHNEWMKDLFSKPLEFKGRI